MKKFVLVNAAVAALLTMPAMAADLPVKAPVAPAAIPYNWTGFYIGAHAGGAWFNKDWFYPCDSPLNFNDAGCGVAEAGHTASSWLAGGQVGYNYQISQWVFGIEAQFSATKIEGSNLSPAFNEDINHSRTDFIGTVAGRVGVAWDRALFYAKGGGAWVHDKFWESQAAGGNFFGPPGAIYATTSSETRWGWMVGGGIEYAFAPNWSAKIEYDYLDLGTRRSVFVPTGAATNFPTLKPFHEDIRQTVQLVKVGVNYKFDWIKF